MNICMAPRTDLSSYDVSLRERGTLNSMLRAESKIVSAPVPRESIEVARHGKSLYEVVTDRDTTRLLFISRDESLLNQTKQSLDGYLDLPEVFDEVHVVILRPGIPAKNPVLRVAPNVWLYIATATSWWGTPFAALRLIREQLEFADGFRPDLIVARDPYESAVVARLIARRYGRAAQLHILEDFTNPQVQRRMDNSRLRYWIASYITKRFLSVRTATNQITDLVKRTYPAIPDVATLPRLNNYETFTRATVVKSLKQKYPQFSFIALYFGALSHESTAYQVIDAARYILQNKRVGLVIVGDGKARSEFEKRTTILGIANQVVFERVSEDMLGYLKTADVLVVSDSDSIADEVVLRGAAAGIPLIVTETPLRADLFTDGDSALFCPPGESVMMSEKLNMILNNFPLRSQLREQALAVVHTRLHEDPALYRRAYRTSVEQGLFVNDGDTSIAPDLDNQPVQ